MLTGPKLTQRCNLPVWPMVSYVKTPNPRTNASLERKALRQLMRIAGDLVFGDLMTPNNRNVQRPRSNNAEVHRMRVLAVVSRVEQYNPNVKSNVVDLTIRLEALKPGM